MIREMISTMTTLVTTTTILTTLDSYTATAMLGATGTVLLINLLIAKELSDSHGGVRSQRLARNIMIAITPLLFAFAMIVAVKVVEVL